jgi:hypothetical protein
MALLLASAARSQPSAQPGPGAPTAPPSHGGTTRPAPSGTVPASPSAKVPASPSAAPSATPPGAATAAPPPASAKAPPPPPPQQQVVAAPPPPPKEEVAAAPPPPPPPKEEVAAAPPPPPPPPPKEEVAAAPPPPAEPAPKPDESDGRERGPFAAHRLRLSLLVGTGSSSRDTYLILGAGLGYYLVSGLELGLDYEAWIGGEPVIQRVSPGVRYVMHFIPVIKPYVGAFYRHAFIVDYEDLDSVGARAGLIFAPARAHVTIGGGAVYERLLGCTATSLVDCDTVYPEVTIGVAF